ncbi:MAG: 3'-5' exonuclease [Trueperaceae bacterium]|nr:3'-5' exonuclease [Trueperaceae bacterium]
MLEQASYQCQGCQRQLRSERFLKQGLCRDCRDARERSLGRSRARAAIDQLLDREDVLILDTETTGMSGAEVIELSVINTKGDTLIDTLIKPVTTQMNPFAQRVHNISMTMLKDAPSWPEVLPELDRIASHSTLLAWNASFDAKMLEQTSEVWGLEHPRWLFVCAMRLYAKKRGIKSRGLHKAVVDENLAYLLEMHQSHRALGDVKFVLEVLRETVKRAD